MGLTQKLGTIPLAIFTDASNNVGIGTAASGSYKLDVNGNSKVLNNLTISSTTNAALIAATNSTTGYTYIDIINNGASGKNYQIGLGGNAAAAGYANNLYFDLVGVGNIMTLTSGRNVGIGTASPANKLSISNNGNAAVAFRINDTNANASFLSLNASNSDAAIIAGGTSAIPFDIYTGGVARFRVSSTGNVGIGTSVPQFTLALPQDSKVGWNDAGSAKRGSITVNSSADAMVFATGTSDTERMRITSGGNVSIGSATDSGFRLYVKGTNGLYIDGGTSSSNSAFLINDNTGGTQYLRVRGDGYLFSAPTYNNTWAGFSANMYIASDGSFGRTTPSSGRYKDNINDWNGKGLETILALKPKTFKYKKDYCETANIDFLGLIAEEVAEVSPYLAQYEKADRTGLVENVRYDIIVVPLIAAIQELSAKVSALENKS
jgi:hypothetical protein